MQLTIWSHSVVKVDRRIRWHRGTTLLLYFAFALVHHSRSIEMVNFTISLALSAGTVTVDVSMLTYLCVFLVVGRSQMAVLTH